MKEQRPPIPLSVKREVRQRCGFGCVICGNPFIQYDHILGYAITKRHKASEITLLCPLCHAKKTSGKIPQYIVEAADKTPFNLRNTLTSKDRLYLQGNTISVIIGNNEFAKLDDGNGTFLIPVLIINKPIIEVVLNNNIISLNMSIYDRNDNVILSIIENELQAGTGVWDFTYEGTTVIIREKKYHILIEIEFDYNLPNKIHIKKGKLFYNGELLTISKNTIQYSGRQISGGIVSQLYTETTVGIAIVKDLPEYSTSIIYRV